VQLTLTDSAGNSSTASASVSPTAPVVSGGGGGGFTYGGGGFGGTYSTSFVPVQKPATTTPVVTIEKNPTNPTETIGTTKTSSKNASKIVTKKKVVKKKTATSTVAVAVSKEKNNALGQLWNTFVSFVKKSFPALQTK
jgi:hypothetical protein